MAFSSEETLETLSSPAFSFSFSKISHENASRIFPGTDASAPSARRTHPAPHVSLSKMGSSGSVGSCSISIASAPFRPASICRFGDGVVCFSRIAFCVSAMDFKNVAFAVSSSSACDGTSGAFFLRTEENAGAGAGSAGVVSGVGSTGAGSVGAFALTSPGASPGASVVGASVSASVVTFAFFASRACSAFVSVATASRGTTCSIGTSTSSSSCSIAAAAAAATTLCCSSKPDPSVSSCTSCCLLSAT
mmetsp:Transcript_2136/g.7397  ORF Transcript_2136/g.7397 Transcript_2136/m.7397 type:complete len:248 (-) Transcript_2136:675-1418(-)